jgi:hypothetical protein
MSEEKQAVVYLDDLEKDGKSLVYMRANANPNFPSKAVNMSKNPNKTLKDLLLALKTQYPSIQIRVQYAGEDSMRVQGQWAVVPDKADLSDGYYGKPLKA